VTDRPLATLTGTALSALRRELELQITKADEKLGLAAERGELGSGHYEAYLRLGGARKAYGDMLSYVKALEKEEQRDRPTRER